MSVESYEFTDSSEEQNKGRVFTEQDIHKIGEYERIYCDITELIHAPMWYHKQGLMQTASGYGTKLNTGLKINFEGKLYRLYTTIYSNNGTTWFTVKGRRIIVS